MHALSGTPVAVPQMLAHCPDSSVIGTEFYVMGFVDGNLYLDPSLPKLSSGGREMVYRAMSSARPSPLHVIIHVCPQEPVRALLASLQSRFHV